jgi:hypothetical protein
MGEQLLCDISAPDFPDMTNRKSNLKLTDERVWLLNIRTLTSFIADAPDFELEKQSDDRFSDGNNDDSDIKCQHNERIRRWIGSDGSVTDD